MPWISPRNPWSRNWHNMKVRTLKASILRLMGQDNSAFLTESLAIDPLYMGLLYEKALHEDSMENFHTVMREEAHNYLELALDYGKAGLYEDAVRILRASDDQNPLLVLLPGPFPASNTVSQKKPSPPLLRQKPFAAGRLLPQ